MFKEKAMKTLFLTGVAALFLATGAAHAEIQRYRGPTTADDPLYKETPSPSALERYRPNYDPNADKWQPGESDDKCDRDCQITRNAEKTDDCVFAPTKALERYCLTHEGRAPPHRRKRK
jgi:hypothetical protein